MSRRLQSLDFTPSPSFWWNPLCKKALPISLLLSSSSSFSAAAEGRRRESFAWWRHHGKLGGPGINQGKLATTRTFERHFVSWYIWHQGLLSRWPNFVQYLIASWNPTQARSFLWLWRRDFIPPHLLPFSRCENALSSFPQSTSFHKKWQVISFLLCKLWSVILIMFYISLQVVRRLPSTKI